MSEHAQAPIPLEAEKFDAKCAGGLPTILLVAGVIALKPYLPDELNRRLDYSHGAKTHEPSHGDSA